MKQFFTLLFTFLFAAVVSAQITISPDVIAFQSDGEAIDVKIDVTNNTNEYKDIYWKFELADDFPEAWGITICDDETCYLENTLQCSPGGPNDMVAGYSFKFKFTINPNEVSGSTYGIIHLYDDSKFENEVAVSKAPITFVKDDIIQEITLYPNPASEYFQIKNDEIVKKVEILSVTGQILLSEAHVADKTYSITHLPKGVFFAILRDENGEKLKTLRLMK